MEKRLIAVLLAYDIVIVGGGVDIIFVFFIVVIIIIIFSGVYCGILVRS